MCVWHTFPQAALSYMGNVSELHHISGWTECTECLVLSFQNAPQVQLPPVDHYIPSHSLYAKYHTCLALLHNMALHSMKGTNKVTEHHPISFSRQGWGPASFILNFPEHQPMYVYRQQKHREDSFLNQPPIASVACCSYTRY